MKIFIDVDNTILEHYHFYSKDTENRTHRAIGNNVEINKEAIKFMYNSSITVYPQSIRNLWEHEEVYILTKYPNLEFDNYKQKKLAEVFNITQEELVNATDNKGHKKYINVLSKDSKVEYVKKEFKTNNIEDFVLVDDYSENIIEWENAGGLGVKYYNDYNSPTHPNIGFSISNFKVLELVVKKNKVSKLFLKYNKSLVIEEVVNYMFEEINDLSIIDVDLEVYKDSLKKIKMPFLDNYDYLPYSKEYYKLVDEFNHKYWVEYWQSYLLDNKKLLFKSSFDIDFEVVCKKKIKEEDFLNIKIIQDKKPETESDIFITINQNMNYIKGNKQLNKVRRILDQLI